MENEHFLPQEEIESTPKFRELLERYMAGDGHMHTTFSNPINRHEADYSYSDLIDYVRNQIDKGTNCFQFMILAEHPSDAANPEKTDGKELIRYKEAIKNYEQELDTSNINHPKILAGVECSIISEDGDIDVPDDVLKEMDLVIASKHEMKNFIAGGKPTPEQLTSIYLKLMDNENIDVIGHPNRIAKQTKINDTILNSDEFLRQMDWQAIFSKANESHTALEININAPMPDWLINEIVKAKVPIFIGTDFHTLPQYQLIPESAEINDSKDLLNYPPGVRLWLKLRHTLESLNKAGALSGQVLTSSSKALEGWLSKEKVERRLDINNES